MKLCHNSWLPSFRAPFGAVKTGAPVRLFLRAEEADEPCAAFLRLSMQEGGEREIEMERAESGFACTVTAPQTPQLLWYSFHVETGGETWYYGNRADKLGGEGAPSRTPPPPFQITVFCPQTSPDRYKNAVCYQIFPDRFCRGEDWLKNAAKKFSAERNGPRSVLRMDWDDRPAYEKSASGEVTHWDFFGGTLSGVREKLSWLEGLGVGALYLNPIFEAASNHRYDTADYLRIDPLLGDEEGFRALCREAAARGISILLDGVFSHTGCDSVYFDKYGNYGKTGAWANPASPYASWFRFEDEARTRYPGWWGVADLPALDKENPDCRRFFTDVVSRWLKAGARGWRLDVADELPDGFIRALRDAVEKADPNGVLLGEVWEDASRKVSYGRLRPYLLGNELHGVMNYPFRDIFTRFLFGLAGTEETLRRAMSLFENYPRDSFYAGLNLIGSHDRMRILTLLGRGLDESGGGELDFSPLSPAERELGKKRLRLLVLLQMTYPGVPCVYYGDEAGLEGGTDPDNRAPYPWGREDGEIRAFYDEAIALRREWPDFVGGDFSPFIDGEDVFGFHRGEMTVLVNRCPYHGVTVKLPSACGLRELLTGAAFPALDGSVTVELPAFGAAVLREDKPLLRAKPLPRGAGVLCHVTSLPSKWGAGGFGRETSDFARRLAEAGQSYWQLLPLNPTDAVGSPYATSSAFAGNPLLLDLPTLAAEGLLTKAELSAAKDALCKASPDDARRVKRSLLRRAFSRFAPDEAYNVFCRENEMWLTDSCLFFALRERFSSLPWQQWPAPFRDREKAALQEPALSREADFFRFCEYEFERQWRAVRKEANRLNVRVVGDLPMYVAEDSADVWAHRELFDLEETGLRRESTGVPPDYFSADGQLWNNPPYRWGEMKKDGFRWWVRRVKQAAKRYDFVRLDHFRGFERYWSVPRGEKAENGRWQFGPGLALFEAIEKELGELPLIAEDLGVNTPAVQNLVHACGIPGMDVLQFSAAGRLTQDAYRARRDAVLYSGTHDNRTLMSWQEEALPNGPPAQELLRLLYESAAPVVIVPMQDILGLDDEARMNTPGVAEKNWRWRFSEGAFSAATAGGLRNMTGSQRTNKEETI